MDRKEFLITLWTKLFKPLIILGVLIFSVRFLIRIFTQNDTERLIAIIVLGFIILSTFSYLLGFVFNKMVLAIKSRLSDQALNSFRIIGKIIDYLTPIVLGVLIYHLWIKDWIIASVFFIAMLINKIIEVVKQEKTGYNN